MTPDQWADEGLYQGDCREVLRDLADNSIDSLVTDPPYGIGFMNRKWDTFQPGKETDRILFRAAPLAEDAEQNPNLRGRKRAPAASPSAVEYDRSLAAQREFQAWTESWAREAIRVLKPGAHGVVFGAPRSHHRMISGLEDAGFEVRDCLLWMFGQGFPKSKNLGGGIGTALKPAYEPIALVRKPLGRLTTTQAFEMYGTSGLAIDACRIDGAGVAKDLSAPVIGRWPANVALDEVAAAALDETVGELKSGARSTTVIRASARMRGVYGEWAGDGTQAYPADVPASTGGPSRFYYCAKVSRAEREFGCDDLPLITPGDMTGGRAEGSAGLNNPRAGAGRTSGSRNAHPTVKPIALMRWLVNLVTPPRGIIIDPFVGSGPTGIAAALENRGLFACDLEAQWLDVAAARIIAWRNHHAAV